MAASAIHATTPPESSQEHRWLITIAFMLAMVMVLLDMTVVSVALPYMMGTLAATPNRITWVLTAYLAANAVTIPLTSHLAALFGRRRLFLISVFGFVVASGLCGASQTLAEIVFLRTLQGGFGALMVVLAQSTMVDLFPGKERGRAMAIWGMVLMVAPAMGPVLGGYITQHMGWRWLFYINLPVGIFSLLLGAATMRESERKNLATDWPGLLLMAIGIGSLQIVLSRGNEDYWFDSRLIVALSILAVFAILIFLLRGWMITDNIINLHLFRDRSFATATLITGVFGLGLFGTTAMQPLMLEGLLNYMPETIGWVMFPRGVASAVTMMIVGRFINRYQPRLFIVAGVLLTGISTWIMTSYSLYISPAWVIYPGIIRGIGMGMIFVPLTVIAFDTLPLAVSAEASGIFNLARTLGNSIGIAIDGTVLTNETQINWNQLGGHINTFSATLPNWLQASGLAPQDPRVWALLGQTLYSQAEMIGFLDVFQWITIIFFCLLPLILLIPRRILPTG
ncbi:MAG: DHA2 family efflux MFS transporter permease subunit [Acidithiobacillus ferrooxidans]